MSTSYKVDRRILFPKGIRPFVSAANFPWNVDSFNILWGGALVQTDGFPNWRETIREYSHLAVIGDGWQLFLVSSAQKHFSPVQLALPQVDVPNGYLPSAPVAWALHPDQPTEPLIITAVHSIVFVINAKNRHIVGEHRGHGGTITSIVVHPATPHIFATTSRDMSTRLYDLTKVVENDANSKNSTWPPGNWPSQTGAPHGLRAFESEGRGMGSCFCVLVGGRAGGHDAAVLSAAFHPIHPIIATCGVDRAVKIWRYRFETNGSLAREDKPLFSSASIHKSRVIHVVWMGEDLLLTHSSPALMRIAESGEFQECFQLDEKSGTLVLWKWLGLNRFFPPERSRGQPQQRYLRGCRADYKESGSWRFISSQHVPIPAWADKDEKFHESAHLHVHASAVQTPHIIYTPILARSVRLLLPRDLKEHKIFIPTMKEEVPSQPEDEEHPEVWKSVEEEPLEPLGGAEISIAIGDEHEVKVKSCAMAVDGKTLLAVGAYGDDLRGCVWLLSKS